MKQVDTKRVKVVEKRFLVMHEDRLRSDEDGCVLMKRAQAEDLALRCQQDWGTVYLLELKAVYRDKKTAIIEEFVDYEEP